MKIIEDFKKIGFIKTTLFIILSSFWILINGTPYIPIGIIIVLLILKKQKFYIYIPFIIASIIGFLGTGIYLNSYTQTKIMFKTGKTIEFSGIKFGFRFGFSTLYHLMQKTNHYIVIYDDNLYLKKLNIAKKYAKDFEKYYNDKNNTFMIDSFYYQKGITKEMVKNLFEKLQNDMGKIKSSKYKGYLYWIYPQHKEHTEISVYYDIDTQKNNNKYRTIMYRLAFDKNSTKLIQFAILDSKNSFKVIKQR